MMTGPLLMAFAWATRPVLGFHQQLAQKCQSLTTTRTKNRPASIVRLFSTSSSASVSLDNCLSRLTTLQTLLAKHGAPGSAECGKAADLLPVTSPMEMPELVNSLSGPDEEFKNLHPYLLPIAKSKSNKDGAFICAYRNPFVEESDKRHPWPIVEANLNGPGIRLIALNSEHLMRRIACEADAAANAEGSEIVSIYNDGLGQGILPDTALDVPYEQGSVEKLGYGVDKYVLLRVGPFADLYQSMAEQHAAKGDEQSSLISAEASNGKLAGFGSNFLFYAKLLATFPNRREESRDAARMCLRLPLPTIGLTLDSFKEVAVLSLAADESDSMDEALAKLRLLYEKMREAEGDDNQADGKTLEQMAIEEANAMLDIAVLSRTPYSEVRSAVAEKFRSVGRQDFANFVDLQS